MAVTWKRLCGPQLITNSVVTQYTVPAATKTRIRHIHIQNNSASPVTLTLSLGADAAGTRIYDAYPIAANDVLNDFGIYVMDAAEILQAVAGTTNKLTIEISGEEITLG